MNSELYKPLFSCCIDRVSEEICLISGDSAFTLSKKQLRFLIEKVLINTVRSQFEDLQHPWDKVVETCQAVLRGDKP